MTNDLPAGWRRASIGDLAPGGIAGGPFGSSLGRKDYRESGVPVIRGANIGDPPNWRSEALVWVSQEKADELARNIALPGDLVLTQRGTLGQVARVPKLHDRFVISQSQMRVRPDESVADSSYLFLAMRSPGFLKQIDQHAIATGVPHINLGILQSLTVPLPSLAEQRAIAGVLGVLDDKIESDRRTSDICREILRLELDALEREDWPEIPVSSLARFVNGGAYTNGATGTGRMVVRIAELNRGPGSSTIYNEIDVPDDRTAHSGDLLMAWSGSLGVHIWLGPDAVINQHIFKVIPNDLPAWLVFDRLERVMPEFRQIAADKATTMGHIKRHHLDDAKVKIPGRVELAALEAEVGPIWLRSLSADLESRTLAELRDALLPELLSGRMRVPVAEEMVEAVT